MPIRLHYPVGLQHSQLYGKISLDRVQVMLVFLLLGEDLTKYLSSGQAMVKETFIRKHSLKKNMIEHFKYI